MLYFRFVNFARGDVKNSKRIGKFTTLPYNFDNAENISG